MIAFMLLEVENLRSLQHRSHFLLPLYLSSSSSSSSFSFFLGIHLLTGYDFDRKKIMEKFPGFFIVIQLINYHPLEN